jgi:glutaminase
MYDFGVCKQCKMEISEERLQAQPVVCNHCGYSPSENQTRVAKSLDRKVRSTMYTISISMCFVFVGLVIWDNHILTAAPIQAKQLLGMASAEDHETMYEICKQRLNVKCQIENLKSLAKYKNEALATLGKTYLLLKKNEEAAKTLELYFRDGGISLDASYDYARALEALGNVDMAGKYYQSILDSKPDTLQITVTKRYVQMLIDFNRRAEAKKVLASVRDKGSNTENFMDMVFQDL